MILRDVRRTMKQLGVASATQLAAELRTGRTEVDSALEFWVQRGDIRVCGNSGSGLCGTACKRCPIGTLRRRPPTGRKLPIGGRSTTPVVYEWVSD
ncbi:MAG: FeoC-like transcriptional regulator [Spirochaetaceae bacterium]